MIACVVPYPAIVDVHSDGALVQVRAQPHAIALLDLPSAPGFGQQLPHGALVRPRQAGVEAHREALVGRERRAVWVEVLRDRRESQGHVDAAAFSPVAQFLRIQRELTLVDACAHRHARACERAALRPALAQIAARAELQRLGARRVEHHGLHGERLQLAVQVHPAPLSRERRAGEQLRREALVARDGEPRGVVDQAGGREQRAAARDAAQAAVREPREDLHEQVVRQAQQVEAAAVLLVHVLQGAVVADQRVKLELERAQYALLHGGLAGLLLARWRLSRPAG